MGKLRVDQNHCKSDEAAPSLNEEYGEDAIASKLEVARQTVHRFRRTDRRQGLYPSLPASSFGLEDRCEQPVQAVEPVGSIVNDQKRSQRVSHAGSHTAPSPLSGSPTMRASL